MVMKGVKSPFYEHVMTCWWHWSETMRWNNEYNLVRPKYLAGPKADSRKTGINFKIALRCPCTSRKMFLLFLEKHYLLLQELLEKSTSISQKMTLKINRKNLLFWGISRSQNVCGHRKSRYLLWNYVHNYVKNNWGLFNVAIILLWQFNCLIWIV